ncbi:hypothetical protein Pr1d_07890 [Bythopirellula goksoeyrii]|uniref:Uncharacterized protein n=1 Tax=Bythopirellula goksoeyrii TaxID=1400387 RepID=A0A5B9Q7H8_9BACT|nr:hypothetical protein Pr1d_07890 [Bythopirellula goksoeyrii]
MTNPFEVHAKGWFSIIKDLRTALLGLWQGTN